MFRNLSIVAAFVTGAAMTASAQQPPPNPRYAAQTTNQPSIAPAPWFKHEGVRRELRLTDDQFERLTRAYSEAQGRYQRGYDVLFSDAIQDAERSRRLRELDASFYQSFGRALEQVLSNQEQRARYDQLWRQYQGYNAFRDATISEKLKLTAEQRDRLLRFNEQWTAQVTGLEANFRTDRDSAVKRWEEMRKRQIEQINSVLTPEQQRQWLQMSGPPYQFDPTMFFPNPPANKRQRQ